MKALKDRTVLRFLIVACVMGMGFQLINTFNPNSIWLVAAMWAPTIAVALLGTEGRAVFRELKKFRWKYVLLAALLGALPAILLQSSYALFNLGSLNPNFELGADHLMKISKTKLPLGVAPQSIGFFALNLTIAILVMASMTTVIGALGEEIGWRGFLQPRLEKLIGKKFVAAALVAFIWAYWHIPVNLTGYNSGGEQIGLVTFVIFPIGVFFMSFILAWLRGKSDAIWPCAVFHGMNNTIQNVQVFKPATAWTESWLGMVTYALTGALFVFLIWKNDQRQEPLTGTY